MLQEALIPPSQLKKKVYIYTTRAENQMEKSSFLVDKVTPPCKYEVIICAVIAGDEPRG